MLVKSNDERTSIAAREKAQTKANIIFLVLLFHLNYLKFNEQRRADDSNDYAVCHGNFSRKEKYILKFNDLLLF